MAPTRATTVSAAKARQNFAGIINRVVYGGERIVLTRHGRAIAGIVPMNDILRLKRPNEQADGLSVQERLVKNLKEELGLSDK